MKRLLRTSGLGWSVAAYLAAGLLLLSGGRPGLPVGYPAPFVYLSLSFGLLFLSDSRSCLAFNGLVCGLATWLVLGRTETRGGETYFLQDSTAVLAGDAVRFEDLYYRNRQTGEPTDTLRARRYWREGRPAGTWLTFSRRGDTLERQTHPLPMPYPPGR